MGYYRKNTNWEDGVGWGEVEDKKFPEVLKKEQAEISGLVKKEVEIPGVFKKKFCGISIGLGF